jgi:hypothetical protein
MDEREIDQTSRVKNLARRSPVLAPFIARGGYLPTADQDFISIGVPGRTELTGFRCRGRNRDV